ncbi:hypothetical protein [Paraburkholderia adhaesiva]|uniref:hypothetical protein n=1 Tax=Paraburkholderia adhaesiva TaxID=2883244 RepID=UPI001F1CBC40|nr:hypothetical protein [Paraburkholderia adhaesiva]
MSAIAFTIRGEAASKSNSRRLVRCGARDPLTGEATGGPRLIKSAKALAFERMALAQIPPRCRVRLDVPVRVTLVMAYASERSDLDESLVLDCLQDRWVKVPNGSGGARELAQRGVITNDRCVREKHVFHCIDRRDPRIEVRVEPLGEAGAEPTGVPGMNPFCKTLHAAHAEQQRRRAVHDVPRLRGALHLIGEIAAREVLSHPTRALRHIEQLAHAALVVSSPPDEDGGPDTDHR